MNHFSKIHWRITIYSQSAQFIDILLISSVLLLKQLLFDMILIMTTEATTFQRFSLSGLS